MHRYVWLLSLLLLVSSCDKYKKSTKALVIDSGNVTPVGCGYLLQLDNGQRVRPVYLPSAFQHDGIRVLVEYNNTGKGSACNPGITYELVDIAAVGFSGTPAEYEAMLARPA